MTAFAGRRSWRGRTPPALARFGEQAQVLDMRRIFLSAKSDPLQCLLSEILRVTRAQAHSA